MDDSKRPVIVDRQSAEYKTAYAQLTGIMHQCVKDDEDRDKDLPSGVLGKIVVIKEQGIRKAHFDGTILGVHEQVTVA